MTPEARVLTMLEQFAGVGYLATVVSRLIGLTGRPRVSVPHFVATGVIQRLWRYRATSFPAPELDHIRYVCMVDERRAREVIGYHPAHDIAETVRGVDDVC